MIRPEVGKWTIKQWEINNTSVIETLKQQEELIKCYEENYEVR